MTCGKSSHWPDLIREIHQIHKFRVAGKVLAGWIELPQDYALESKRGAQENLWPKFILESAPVARHFVWPSLKHLLYHSDPTEKKEETIQFVASLSKKYKRRETFTVQFRVGLTSFPNRAKAALLAEFSRSQIAQ